MVRKPQVSDSPGHQLTMSLALCVHQSSRSKQKNCCIEKLPSTSFIWYIPALAWFIITSTWFSFHFWGVCVVFHVEKCPACKGRFFWQNPSLPCLEGWGWLSESSKLVCNSCILKPPTCWSNHIVGPSWALPNLNKSEFSFGNRVLGSPRMVGGGREEEACLGAAP